MVSADMDGSSNRVTEQPDIPLITLACLVIRISNIVCGDQRQSVSNTLHRCVDQFYAISRLTVNFKSVRSFYRWMEYI